MTATVAVEDTLDWDRFAERYWDRAPVLYRRVETAPFEAAEALDCAVVACRTGPADAVPELVRLTSDGRRLSRAVELLPAATDADFAAYAGRVGAALGGRRHALMISGFHPHHFPLWERERAFYAPLWQRIGLPMTTAITTLFHGNYEHSPVGVHRDRFGTFMYVLSGRKRMRMWPRRPWDHDATTILDYAGYLDDSITAEAGPGQLLYWPASHYHVGETVGDEAATSVNVGIPREERRVAAELTELLVDIPAARWTDPEAYLETALPPVTVDPVADDATERLPEPLRQGLDTAAALLRDSWAGERRLTVTVNRYTAGGLRPVPEATKRPRLLGVERLARVDGAQILWARTETGTAVCSGNGHAASARPSAEAVAALLSRLEVAGSPRVTVTELLAAVSVSDREDCRELLAELCAFRVLRQV